MHQSQKLTYIVGCLRIHLTVKYLFAAAYPYPPILHLPGITAASGIDGNSPYRRRIVGSITALLIGLFCPSEVRYATVESLLCLTVCSKAFINSPFELIYLSLTIVPIVENTTTPASPDYVKFIFCHIVSL